MNTRRPSSAIIATGPLYPLLPVDILLKIWRMSWRRQTDAIIATGPLNPLLPVDILLKIWRRVIRDAATSIQRLFRAMRARDTLLSSWASSRPSVLGITRRLWIGSNAQGYIMRQRRRYWWRQNWNPVPGSTVQDLTSILNSWSNLGGSQI